MLLLAQDNSATSSLQRDIAKYFISAPMSLLVDYGSSEDEGAGSSASADIPKFPSATRIVAAPDVSLEVE